MKKIERSDILDLESYENAREHMRSSVIELKKNRRLLIGNHMSLVWENRQTMLFQIQEMLRIEHIRNEDAIRHEIDTYNDLVPGPNELKATLYIEYEDKDERALMLSRFRTLPGSVYLDIGERSYKAAFKQQDGEEDDRLPAVNYLRFGLDPQSRSALAAAETKVALRVTHPNYAQTAILSDDSKKALSHDLLQE